MTPQPYDSLTLREMMADAAAVEAAIRDSVREALATHKRLGQPVVTWQDGKVVWIPADQIPAEINSPQAH